MSHLPLAVRESIKTGLAMALACGVAMALGWSNPYWVCIAVAVVSLPTVGESLRKCVQRLWGTFVGAGVALLLYGLFAQQRWAFLFGLSAYLGLCAYRITVSRAVYFWFLSGYVCVLIAAAIIGTSPHQAFATAVLRLQETGLGILVYAVVSVFLWPQRGVGGLEATVASLLGVQSRLLHVSFSLLRGKDLEEPVGKWANLADQLLGQLRRRLDAADLEQFEVGEMRGWWRRLLAAFQAMLASLRLWQESFPELRRLDLDDLLPDLRRVQAALMARMSRLQAVMEGKEPRGRESLVELRLERERLAGLSHLQRASVLTTVAALGRVEAASRALADCLLAVKGRGADLAPPQTRPARGSGRPVDADSFIALLRGLAAVWIASLIWIYVDPPGHTAFVVFVGLFTLMGVMAPQMDWLKFLCVNFIGVVIAAVLYVCVMPSLSGFWEFGLLMFCLTSFIFSISWHPRLTALKLAGVVPFIMMTNIQNHQTYDFALFLNNAAAMLSGILCTAGIFHLPISSRPEKMFLRLRARFFRQAERFLAHREAAPATDRGRERMAAALAAMEATLAKLGGWANSVDYAPLRTDSRQEVAAVLSSLGGIVRCCALLSEAPPVGRAGPGVMDGPFEAWNRAVRIAVGRWGQDVPDAAAARDVGNALRQEYERLEQAVEEGFETVSNRIPQSQATGLYRLLGSYRGIHRALVDHAALAAAFDWERWRETRF
ncbi:FUSC family protein [Solidesulfovibrio sp.]|uniref:FUSC family protein n=1 Tax=Solidesulfovibrio sp. TaxID=2910990 RepID=UPI002611BCF1|nr:FUSC family protein [Solidesulfovibrio sp.]